VTLADQERTDLAARYGTTRQRGRRQRILGWATAIAFVVVFAAWVIWVAFDNSNANFQSLDTGHKVVDETTTRISFEVSMPPGSTASCALQVQNEMHAIVGWKIVEIPASDKFTQAFTETVRSTEQGVTGLIYDCWLT
jgi:hypothetical protein